MDQKNFMSFITRYREFDGDELLELHNRRDTLTEDAILALDAVLQEKGVSKDILSRYSETPSVETAPPDVKRTTQLSQSFLARVCQAAFILPAWLPVQHVVGRSGIQIGGIWAGLLAGVLIFVGYRIGQKVTQSICVSDNIGYQKKKIALWLLLVGVVFLYFILYGIADSFVAS